MGQPWGLSGPQFTGLYVAVYLGTLVIVYVAQAMLSRLGSVALRYVALDGTDHATHKEQGSMVRRYIIWRNKHGTDERLRKIVSRANVA
jgi:hypothetical protein